MGAATASEDDSAEVSVDFLDDSELEEDEGGEVSAPRVRLGGSADIRRKIEERLERRRLQEELGVSDDELDF